MALEQHRLGLSVYRGREQHDAECLATHPLFAMLPPDVLVTLGSAAKLRRYRKGQDLFQSGDPSTYVYFVKAGLVALTGLDERGSLAAVVTFSTGEVFGVAPAVLGLHHPWTATALLDTEMLLIPRPAFCAVYEQYPELATLIMRGLCDTLYRSQQTAMRLALTPAKARVAEFLLEQASEAPSHPGGEASFELSLSHRSLALLLGTTRETVTRILSGLMRAGVIVVRGRWVAVKRPDMLRRLADGTAYAVDGQELVTNITASR